MIKILSVDDELDLELLLTQYFRRKIRKGEYEFYFAHNGVEAMQMLLQHPDIDIVLSDINMPEMDGLTLLKKIKDRNNPALKVVMVSAYGDMKNIRQVTFVLKNHLGRSLGLMLLITLVSLAITFPVLNMSQTIAVATGSPVLGIILNVIVETVLSIFNIYMNIAMVLRFMNLEQICGENSIF